MGAAASAGSSSDNAVSAIDKIPDEIDSNMNNISQLSDQLTIEARNAVLIRLLSISNVQDELNGSSSRARSEPNADQVGVRTRQKSSAEELIDDVEMEAAVDDEINTLLFEFVSLYGTGDEQVDKHVISLFSREEFRPDILDSFGNSLVVKAVQEKNVSFLQLALNYGGSEHTQLRGCDAPHLVCYVESYDFDVANILVSMEMNSAIVTSTGLHRHYAVETRSKILDVSKTGASPTAGDEDKTPLDYAEMCKEDDVTHDGKLSDGIIEVIH